MTEAADFDPRALRRAFGAFATGVTIAATLDDRGAPVGLTANSFTSVSLDPPLVLVCVGHGAAALGAFRSAGRFAVSVLSAAQRDAAMVFATRGADKFAAVAWAPRVTGAPVIEGCAAWFDCETEIVTTLGDHDAVVGRVRAFGRDDARPLGYHAGRFVEIGAPVRLTAVVTQGGRALVREDADQGFFLPSASAYGPATDRASLLGQIAAQGPLLRPLQPAGAHDDGPVHVVVYRAEAEAGFEAGPGWRFAPLVEAEAGMASPEEACALRRAADMAPAR
jgi:flavin reductase (DIM6/NTAB) family NADH-FMN oxidoreductase RutF